MIAGKLYKETKIRNNERVYIEGRGDYFRKVLISYLLILLIPLCTGLISYRISVSVAKSSAVDQSLAVLEQSQRMLESRMEEVENFVRELSLQPSFATLLYSHADVSDKVVELREVVEQLSVYASTSYLLRYFYIYIWDKDIVLSPGSAYLRPSHFYELQRFSQLEYKEWRQRILRMPHMYNVLPLQPYQWDQRQTSVITVVQTLPFYSGANPKGTVVIPIDVSHFQSLLDSFVTPSGGWAFMRNEHGELLASAGISPAEIEQLDLSAAPKNKEYKLEDGSSVYMLSIAEENGWSYVAAIPKSNIMEGAGYIQRMTIIVMLVTLVIGGLASLFLARRNIRPLSELVASVHEHLDYSRDNEKKEKLEKNAYDFLQGNFSLMIRDHESLRSELVHQEQILKDSFLRRLIHEEFHSRADLMSSAAQVGLTVSQKGAVILLKIHGYGDMEGEDIYEELAAAKVIVKKVLQAFQPNPLTVDLQKDELVFWLNIEEQPDQKKIPYMKEQLTELRANLQEEFSMEVTMTVGPWTPLFETSRSYEQARRMLDYSMLKNESGVFWHDQYEAVNEFINYPIEIEVRLIKALKTGEVDIAIRLVNEVLDQLLEKEQPPLLAQQWLAQVKGTFLRALSPQAIQQHSLSRLKKALLEIKLSDGRAHVQAVLEDIIRSYAECQQKMKNAAGEETVLRMKRYIDQHFSEPSLTNYDVAKVIGLPEKYISQLFKQQTGQSISEYVMDLRLRESMTMLTETNETVQAISECVGYNSPHSFRRAFKRIIGLTPQQYRKTMRSGHQKSKQQESK
ncbi:helix-turn-helix domain-containing protein [Bacillaceae bacterium SIJ1]|uniref:helix-turn-helix domain-containing protein n=1 Tax=Litoribacterium kuwaitense TaxID=1398745 RepID=UPI0013EBEBC5|nr:helix-turn-helix domain-containing protein [Litoribacterium kuwaitense]NGP46587.1 helix-turn-helix domain-containing protein [Litoribacterium kuwaitense]